MPSAARSSPPGAVRSSSRGFPWCRGCEPRPPAGPFRRGNPRVGAPEEAGGGDDAMSTNAGAKAQGPPFAEHNVVAVFPDMERAHSAVDALQRGGVDGAEISLLGRAVEET